MTTLRSLSIRAFVTPALNWFVTLLMNGRSKVHATWLLNALFPLTMNRCRSGAKRTISPLTPAQMELSFAEAFARSPLRGEGESAARFEGILILLWLAAGMMGTRGAQKQIRISSLARQIRSGCYVLVFTLLAGLVLHAAAPIGFEQVQRINQLTLQFGTDTFATSNRFGDAIDGGTARAQMQQIINNAIADGSSSTLFTFPGLVDLTGTNAPSLSVGVEGGVPFLLAGNPAQYSAASNLDWWYLLDPLTVDAGGNALRLMPGGITNQVLSVGPGPFAFANLPLTDSSGGVGLALSSTFVKAMTSTSSIPLRSTNNFPPGHRPGEQINPALVSFTTMTNGQLKGNISALSLAITPAPSSLLGGGLTACSQGYTAQNSFLDLVVGGCTVLFIAQITSTQPDQFDTNAPATGAGPPYTFQTNALRQVAIARDRSNAVVNLQTALAASSYSAYFKFTTVRVMAFTAPNGALNIGGLSKLGNGAFHLAFTQAPRATFTILAATNITPPVNWTVLSDPTQTMSGVFEFADPGATNLPRRFYRVRSP